jgi:hypothetical protein
LIVGFHEDCTFLSVVLVAGLTVAEKERKNTSSALKWNSGTNLL